MPINLDIPRTMTFEGLTWLERLAKEVPEDGVIVEVGPLYGSSTWTLAQSAHPSVTVYSIDTWERAPWIIKNVEEKLGAPAFSIDAFKSNVDDCPNVVPIQGFSPDVVSDWDKPIDLYFDDAAHRNPDFANNLNFFNQHVKPDGVLCGDDYALGSPDIVREVDALGAQWNARPEVAGRVWALRKPAEGSETSEGVSALLPPLEGPQLTVTTHCDIGGVHQAPPLMWSGQLQKPGALRAFSIDWSERPEGTEVVYRCANDDDRSPLCSTGELCHIGAERQPITSITVELLGPNAHNYEVRYQAGIARDADCPYKLKYNTPLVRSGNELRAPSARAFFSALRVLVVPNERA